MRATARSAREATRGVCARPQDFDVSMYSEVAETAAAGKVGAWLLRADRQRACRGLTRSPPPPAPPTSAPAGTRVTGSPIPQCAGTAARAAGRTTPTPAPRRPGAPPGAAGDCASTHLRAPPGDIRRAGWWAAAGRRMTSPPPSGHQPVGALRGRATGAGEMDRRGYRCGGLGAHQLGVSRTARGGVAGGGEPAASMNSISIPQAVGSGRDLEDVAVTCEGRPRPLRDRYN